MDERSSSRMPSITRISPTAAPQLAVFTSQERLIDRLMNHRSVSLKDRAAGFIAVEDELYSVGYIELDSRGQTCYYRTGFPPSLTLAVGSDLCDSGDLVVGPLYGRLRHLVVTHRRWILIRSVLLR